VLKRCQYFTKFGRYFS